MKLYLKECKKIASSILYYLFIAILVFSWSQNFRGVTQAEINRANGITPAAVGFERPLLSKPSKEGNYFGSKISEEDPEAIMTGVTRTLLSEYEDNSYATYPLGYYKVITLSSSKQKQVLEILCEITGLTEEELKNLPDDYFPAVTGTMISFEAMNVDKDGNLNIEVEGGAETKSEDNKYKHFVSQVTYEHFKKLMQVMEDIIGEKGSQYSHEMMITYFGISEMNYEEALEEYNQTINKDKVTGGFARLFCDYMGLELGLYPIFLVVMIWMKDRMSNAAELIYSRKVSSAKLVISRYAASITMILLPILLLSFESLVPLITFGAEKSIVIDYFAYIKYILWWLLPEVMVLCAIGIFFTLLTDSPIAIVIQFLWWMVDKGITGLSGDTKFTTLMIRHNTLRGYEIIQEDLQIICMNRLLMAGIGILFVSLSIWILTLKRSHWGMIRWRLKAVVPVLSGLPVRCVSCITDAWRILKVNFHLAIRTNLLVSFAYLLTIPLLRGISNLDRAHSAECLEQSVILIGIFLIVPLNKPEQSKAIREVVYAKKISHWKILLLRFATSILLLTIMICLFCGIMIWKNCTFPFGAYAAETAIRAMALGSLGLAVSILSNSVMAGYLASAAYFLLNFVGNTTTR